MPTKLETFLERIPAGAPAIAEEHIKTSWAIYDRVATQIAAIRADRDLTLIGQLTKIERELKNPLEQLRQIRADIEKRRSDATGQRRVLRERVTSSDVYSETRLQEVRTWLRSLDQQSRMKAMQSKDDLIEQSVIGAPHYLSSTPKDLHEAMIETAVEARFPGAMAQIEVLEKAFDAAGASAQLALDDIRRASDLPPDEFGKLAA